MIRYFADHPTAANLLLIAFLVLGIASVPALKRETFPDIPADEVSITAAYPGATALEVEDAICQRIEEALDGILGLRETRCAAREGVATATAKKEDNADMARFLDDIKSGIDAITSFPDDVERPVITEQGMTDYVTSVAITGPMSVTDLKAYAEQIKDHLLGERTISQINIRGFADHQIRIEVPMAALHRYNLSINDIAQAISDQNIARPSGSLETRDGTLLIRMDDERRAAKTIGDLVVFAGDQGGEVRLSDIATISDRFENDDNKIIFNGQRAAWLEIIKNKDQDSLEVVDAVHAMTDDLQAKAPQGITLTISQDVSSIVRDRLNMLTRNGLQGLVMVFAVMWLFFGLKYSFWVAAGLPVSFMGTFFAMTFFGYSIDMITMVGLLIAVGLLMDDAIVIAENVAAKLRQGLSPFEAAVQGTRQVAPGVMMSFLTTICVFGSLMFLTGRMGHVLKVMPAILIMTLAVSLIEAFLILPHHLAHSLKKGAPKRARLVQAVDDSFEWVRHNIVEPAVDVAVRWRYLTVGGLLALLILSIALIPAGVLKFRAFPDLESNVIQAKLLLPQGTPLSQTEQVVKRITDALRQIDEEYRPAQPDGQNLVKNIAVQYGTNSDAYESGPHVATVHVDLLNAEIRSGTTDDITARWRTLVGDVPDVISLVYSEREVGPAGRPIEIRLQGRDLAALKAAALELRGWLSHYEGVHDLTDDLRPGKQELKVSLRDGAGSLGVTADLIGRQLAAAFQGVTVDEIQIGPEAYEIDVRLAENDRNGLDDFDRFHIKTPGGDLVPLSAVAEVSQGRGYARVHRVNSLRTVTVQGLLDTDVANAQEIISHTAQTFLPQLAERYPTVTAALEGQAAETADTMGSMQRNFIIGLIGVFLLLSFQFRSYVEPFTVMLAIPMGLIGVIWGHLAQGLELSMPSMLGLASLAGVVVNDTILMVEFIKQARRNGMKASDAARTAARQRFRAIFLTSVTTIAGLTPLLLEKSLQAQVLIPMATSLAFGITSATLLSLLLVPAAYTIFDDFGWTVKEHVLHGAGLSHASDAPEEPEKHDVEKDNSR